MWVGYVEEAIVRKIIGMFVDHQEIVQYPVGIVSNTLGCFDHIYWFGSDEQNAGLLEDLKASHQFKDKITVITLGHKIECPGDIGVAQELSVAWMRQMDGANITGYQQADLCLTLYGAEVVNKRIESCEDLPNLVFAVPAMQNKLYCETYYNPSSCFFLGDTEYYSPGDGWENYHRLAWMPNRAPMTSLKEIEGEPRLMIDLGYLGTEMYHRKRVNHSRIWSTTNEVAPWLELFMRDKDAAIIQSLHGWQREVGTTRVPEVVDYEGMYKTVIDQLGLWDDYCYVRELCSRM